MIGWSTAPSEVGVRINFMTEYWSTNQAQTLMIWYRLLMNVVYGNSGQRFLDLENMEELVLSLVYTIKNHLLGTYDNPQERPKAIPFVKNT